MFGFYRSSIRFSKAVSAGIMSVGIMSALMLGLILGALSTPVCAQDFAEQRQGNWHQWRGPDASGVSQTANPPLNWNAQSNIKWRVPIVGQGSSTPIVWKDSVIILSAVETNDQRKEPYVPHPESLTVPPNSILEFVVWCFERETGDVRWKKVVVDSPATEGVHPSTTYAAASPTTDGKHIFASFGSYGIFCLTFDGDLVWKKDLGEIRTRKGWGEAVSPVLHEQFLIVNWDQEDDSKIFVLNAANGEILWQDDRDEPTTWATPMVVEHNGTTQLLTNGTNRIRSYDLKTGEIIWESPGTTLNAIPCPVIADGNVICMGGYKGNLAVSVSLDSKGSIDATKTGPEQLVKWKYARHTPYVPSPLILESRLYFTKHNRAMLSCLDLATGEPNYDLTRLPALKNMYASPVAANGRIYLTSREGSTLVIKDSDKFEVLATNHLKDEIDASPALAGNQLFLRSRKFLYCIEEKD